MKRKILLTGFSGKVGYHIVNMLKDEFEIIGFGNLQADWASIQQIIGNITDTELLEATFIKYKPDYVIHLAALLPHICAKDKVECYKINTDATTNFAKLAQKHQVKKFIFASTSAIYGDKGDTPYKETDTPNPQNEYAKSKLQAEDDLMEIATKSEMQILALRIFNIYGELFDRSLINTLISSTDEAPAIISSPDKYIRDYIHIKDVVNIMQIALHKSNMPLFDILNAGTGEETSTSHLEKKLKSKGLDIHTQMTDTINITYSCANIDKLKENFKYTPIRELIVDDNK